MNNETIQSLRNYALADKAKTTPRTDAATIPFDAKGCERDDRVPVSFARQLERELQQATADNSSLAERLTAAELERDRLGAELEELQGSHDLNQIASDALNDLRAELARVTAELDGYRSDIERFVWNLAGCDTIASGWGKPGDYNEEMALPALDSVSRMASERDALRARVAEVEKERDEWKRNAEADTESMDAANRRAEQAEQRVAELEATIAELTTDGNAATLAANLAKASKRNAELVEQLKAYGKYAHDTTLEDQNAELVAALEELYETANRFPTFDGSRLASALDSASAALARNRAAQEASK